MRVKIRGGPIEVEMETDRGSIEKLRDIVRKEFDSVLDQFGERGWEKEKFFHLALKAEMNFEKGKSRQDAVRSYISRGFYSYQIMRLWRLFGLDNVEIVLTEDLRNYTQGTLDRLRWFLGVDPFVFSDIEDQFSQDYKTSLSSAARRYLEWAFEPEIILLERLLIKNGQLTREWLTKTSS